MWCCSLILYKLSMLSLDKCFFGSSAVICFRELNPISNSGTFKKHLSRELAWHRFEFSERATEVLLQLFLGLNQCLFVSLNILIIICFFQVRQLNQWHIDHTGVWIKQELCYLSTHLVSWKLKSSLYFWLQRSFDKVVLILKVYLGLSDAQNTWLGLETLILLSFLLCLLLANLLSDKIQEVCGHLSIAIIPLLYFYIFFGWVLAVHDLLIFAEQFGPKIIDWVNFGFIFELLWDMELWLEMFALDLARLNFEIKWP